MMANSQTFTLNIKALFDASQVTSGAKQIQDIFKNIKLPTNLQSDFNKAFSNLESSVSKVQQKYEQGFKTKGDVSSFEKSFKEMENAAAQYEKVIQRIQAEVGTSVDLSKLIKWDDSTLSKLKAVDDEIKRIKSTLQFNVDGGPLSKIETALKGITSNAPKTVEAVNNFKKALIDGDLQGAEEQLTKLENIWSRFKGKDSYNAIFGENGQGGLRELFNQLKETGVFAELEKLQGQKGEIQTAGWEKIVSLLQKAGVDVRSFNGALGETKGQIQGAASAQQAWNSQLDQFKSRIQYFFGLNNVIQLVRRSLREAFNTVKELDAAMAQTAVVTDYTISDMWNQLPKYTSIANELGVTTKGAYETMTLFYQQGLDSNEAFALGTETMKMARIAGLDYATATDYMTAALRGFNMELTELSAQRVNDVYSRLAAITASDTQEISTAMTKVASLAHNANMEFETTSAFLAQIIETTRESAETAGTALKTVVARFSEVKKLYSENTLKGQDEEGEIIDVNKVSAALRTAGIDMNKYFLGEVGLDDIFMELASKWDSLTAVQQRYIATQAAGSRQQSRFIAMMSNYSRTQELVAEAYNSTGASEKQFEKTQASLETALNRLNNAWDQFTMNLANESAIKSVINLLTDFLNVVNKITGVFSGGWRSVITGGLALGGLFGGGKLVNAAFSASKIAKANTMAWGAAFKNQLSNNPMLYNTASGELIQQEGIQQYGQRFHLFGQGGYFSPYSGGAPLSDDLTNQQKLEELTRRQSLQLQRRTGGGIAAAGLAFSAAGSAISHNAETIADAFDTTSEKAEKFGQSISTMGNSLSIAGTMFMMLPPGINAVAAAIIALVGAWQAFHPETAAESLKRLTEESKQADQAAEDAKKAYEELLSGVSSHNELLDKISELKEGTLEFRKAILDANEAALKLINNYNLTSSDYTRTKNGLITFNPGVINRIQNQQIEAAEKAQQRASIARLSMTSQQEAIDSEVSHLTKMVEQGIVDSLENADQDTIDKWIEAAQNGSTKRLEYAEEWLGENVSYTAITGKQIAKQAAERGYGTDYARYINDVRNGTVQRDNSISLQRAYSNALVEAVGPNMNDAIQLGIDSLVDSFDANQYNTERKQVEREVDAMGSAEARAEYREKVGEIIGDIPLDQIKDELAQTLIAEKLRERALDAGTKAQKNATRETINYQKTQAKEVLKKGAEQGNEDAYAYLAAKKTQEIISKTTKALAEFTDLNPLANLGEYTVEQNKQLGEAANSLGSTFGKMTATAVVAEIENNLNNGDSGLLNAITSANFSGEFGALSTNLKNLRDSFTDAETGARIFELALSEVGGYEAVFQSFYHNNQDLIDSFEKLADEAGNIPADAIFDAIDGCDELADMLEVCDINAAGLAAALSEITLDHLNAEQITETLLKALSAAEGVNQVLAQGDNYLNNWKEAPSGARFANWGTGGAKTIVEAWDKGRFWDQQAIQYLEAMLPLEARRRYTQTMSSAGNIAWEQGDQEAIGYIRGQMGPEIGLMKWLQESDNLSPLYAYYEQYGDLAENSLVDFSNGMVHFADSITTADEAFDTLSEALHNEDLASVMLGDFLNTSPDALPKWSRNAAQQGIDVFKETLEQGGTVLEGELETYYNKYAHFFDENDEIWGSFETFKSKFDGEVIDLKVNWTTSDDPFGELTKAFEKNGGIQGYLAKNGAFGGSKIGGVLAPNTDFNTLNVDATTQAFQKLGATEAQALTLADQYADSLREAGNETVNFSANYDKWNFDENSGKWIKTTEEVNGYATAVEAAAGAQAEAQKSLMEMQATMNAQAFGDMLKSLGEEGVDIKITYDQDDFESHDGDTEDITIEYDQSSFVSHDGEIHSITIVYSYKNSDGSSAPPGGTPPSGGGTSAKGGIVGSYASGSASRHISPGPALTGEEGAEIVWNKDKGYAYITGEEHPEFQNLQPGDRVFNAQETKKILGGAAAGGKVPSLATGYLSGLGISSSSKKSSGGGGGGGRGGSGSEKEKTPEEWKNELDWLYNLMEDIAELERDQKAIEEQYEDLLQDQTKTGGDLYRLLVKQLGNLYTQLNHQTFALEKREQEMREFMDTTNDKDQYLWYNWQDRTLEIDWDAIDRITDEEEYKHVKELVDEAEEIQDKIDDADDAIMDITNQIQELENIWRDTFVDFENRVLDAIVKSYQQVIDNYSELNDTLNNSNTQILDSLQKQISLERQIRDNTKTEEEISDEEARLAYLRRDTSGGNDLAALQLERELTDQRENYEDSLVDQAISRLQEDNDAAAQQREKQIEIMQAQLDYQAENGEFNAYISELLATAMGADGELLTNSDLVTLLKEQENWDAMSAVSKQVWDEELNGTFKEVAAFLLKQNAEENGTFYTALTAAVNSVSTAIGSYSQAMTKLGDQIASVGSSGGGGGGGSGGGGGGVQKKQTTAEPVNHLAAVRPYSTPNSPYQIININTGKKMGGIRYATGGLSTSTGLAWLDGTPSEPEYVLNARQTDAFLKLADVLPSMMNGTSTTTSNTFGATYVNLSVNLESVSPDYDVDRMVNLVKDKLYDVGSYRNVNSLSFLR